MPATLTFRGGAIMGAISGQMIHCLARPAQVGKLPPAGQYRIGAPINDVVYGPFASMTPLNGGGISGLFNPTGGRTATIRQERPGYHPVAEPGVTTLSQGSAAFALSTRPIAGRNCLILSGETGLLQAIAAAGGAEITVY